MTIFECYADVRLLSQWVYRVDLNRKFYLGEGPKPLLLGVTTYSWDYYMIRFADVAPVRLPYYDT